MVRAESLMTRLRFPSCARKSTTTVPGCGTSGGSALSLAMPAGFGIADCGDASGTRGIGGVRFGSGCGKRDVGDASGSLAGASVPQLPGGPASTATSIEGGYEQFMWLPCHVL